MTPSLDGCRFAEDDRVVTFAEDREGTVTAAYSGGSVVAGTLAGRRDGSDLSFGFSQIERNGRVTVGTCEARLELLDGGLLRIAESWRIGDERGSSVLEELPGTRWLRTRVAHPTRSVADAIDFYSGVLGLPHDGPHPATPYELVFFDLPGGAQLELTAGGDEPVAETRDDLLVLYVPTPADVAALTTRLTEAGIALEEPLNPYWARTGVTVRDPDGRLVVLAHKPA